MAIEVDNIADLDAAAVQQNQAEITQRLQEDNPSLDFKRGPNHDLLAYYHAALATQTQTGLARYNSARSLQAILEDPTLADEGVVDEVLSNWGLTRQAGTAARGQVLIVLSTPVSVTIGSGAVFTANGQTFTSDAAYTARTQAALVQLSTDRLLVQLSDGNWGFTIEVTAAATGTAGLIKKDTLVIPEALPTAYVTSYASADFTGGLDAETNQALAARQQEGIAAKAPSNRPNMKGMLRAQAAYSRVVASSIVGLGNPEMLRDQHTIWPGSLGGRADWYVRTTERIVQQVLAVPATLLSVDTAGHGTWQISLDRNASPGFYEAAAITLPSADNTLGSFAITADIRGLDLTGAGFVPDIQTTPEGVYSRFQVGILQFVDSLTDDTATPPGTVRTYRLTLRTVPQIGEIQDWLSDEETRGVIADTLVKAPIPCFLTLSLTISKNNRQADPDLAAVKDALATEVNNVAFIGRLSASQLQDVVHGYLADGMTVSAIDMFGRVRRPDGTTLYLRSSELLSVPEERGTMVSPRTVAFFLDPADVAIAVKTEVPLPV